MMVGTEGNCGKVEGWIVGFLIFEWNYMPLVFRS